MNELYDLIKKEATMIFHGDNHHLDASFGYEPLNPGKLLHTIVPYEHYKKFSIQYLRSPKSFKTLIAEINNYQKNTDRSLLEIFHYPIHQKTVHRLITKMAETEEFISKIRSERAQERKHESKLSDKEAPVSATFHKEEYIKNFMTHFEEKYGPETSSILIPTLGWINIIAKRDIMNSIAAFLKDSSQNIEDLPMKTDPADKTRDIKWLKDYKKIIIYDMVSEPKITVRER